MRKRQREGMIHLPLDIKVQLRFSQLSDLFSGRSIRLQSQYEWRGETLKRLSRRGKYRNYVARIRSTFSPFSLLWRTRLGLPLFAFDNAFDCTDDALQRKQMRLSMAGPFKQDKCEPALSHLRSLLRVTEVRGARNTFTTDNTQPGKIYGTNGRNERVKMKNDVDERGIKAAPFSPLMMRYL